MRSRLFKRITGAAAYERRIAELEAELSDRRRRNREAQHFLKKARGEREELRAQLAATRETLQEIEALQRDRPSTFTDLMMLHRGVYNAAGRLKDRTLIPRRQIPFKLRNYAFAESHGVQAPEVYGVWSTAQNVDLSDVAAERVVVKCDGGYSAQGVVVLRRSAQGWETVDGTLSFDGHRLPREIAERLGAFRGPFFAEEFLGAGEGLPEDVKIYAAYGRILQVLVMKQERPGAMRRGSFGRRFFDAEGRDLGEVMPGAKYDASIEAPSSLPQMVEQAKTYRWHYPADNGEFEEVDITSVPRRHAEDVRGATAAPSSEAAAVR